MRRKEDKARTGEKGEMERKNEDKKKKMDEEGSSGERVMVR